MGAFAREELALIPVFIVGWFIVRAISKWYSNQLKVYRSYDASTEKGRESRDRWISFCVSTFNSGAIVAMSYTLYVVAWDDFYERGWKQRVCGLSCALLLWSYFFVDWIVSYKVWTKYPSECLHHILGMGLVGVFFLEDGYCPYAAPFMSVETSTLFYNAQWMMLKMGYSDKHVVVRSCQVLFALCFFLLRVVYLPYLCHKLIMDPVMWGRLPTAHYATGFFLVPIQLLQFYWFAQIVQKLAYGSRKRPSNAGKDSAGKDS